MTRRTRYFLIGSSLVLIVGLCTGLVAYYNGALPLRTSTVGPEELAYVPGSTTAVAFANVHDVMNSEFRQKLRQAFPTGEEKDKIQTEIGVDIEHDIDTVTAGFTGVSAPDGKTAVVLVRGKFDDNRIESVATQHGGAAEQYKGKKVIVMSDHGGASGDRSDAGAVAFLEPGLLALGSAASVRLAVDAAATGENVTKNAELMKYVGELTGRNTVWAVGHLEGSLADSGLPQQAKDQLAAIQWFTANLHVDGGVSGVVRAIARDDKAAENLRDVVRGGLAAAHLMAGHDTRLDAVVNSVQVTGTGNDVAVSFTVPPEILDMINGLAGMHNLQKGPKPPAEPKAPAPVKKGL
ncbi:MAG TPA: hypothetical protein VLT86_07580 [Vicinamibacterales bacterium]|nr:hypothetical protein [Vicinamibacterales bacterium]